MPSAGSTLFHPVLPGSLCHPLLTNLGGNERHFRSPTSAFLVILVEKGEEKKRRERKTKEEKKSPSIDGSSSLAWKSVELEKEEKELTAGPICLFDIPWASPLGAESSPRIATDLCPLASLAPICSGAKF